MLTQAMLDAGSTNWQATYPRSPVTFHPSRRIVVTNQIGGLRLPRTAVRNADNPDVSTIALWIRRRGTPAVQQTPDAYLGAVDWRARANRYYGISYDYWRQNVYAPWANQGPVVALSGNDPLYNGPAQSQLDTNCWDLLYPCWEHDRKSGGLVFLLDRNFFGKPFGKYEAAVVCGGVWSGSVELDYRPFSPIVAFAPEALPYDPPVFPAKPDIGVTVYDAISDFDTTLSGVLEFGATVLPLAAADVERLAGWDASFGVELVVTDDVRSETVLYRKPQNGFITIERDRRNTGGYRFAAGSRVAFAWTPYNVQQAKEIYVRLGV